MKKDVLNLPDHYILQAVIDLKKNKKQALGVNLCALIIAAIMVLVAVKFVPLKSAYAGASLGMVKLGVIIAGMVAYIILHELVHGFLFWAFSGQKPFYGFTGLYAYAGSSAYYCRSHYIIIGLAPVVGWGLVLGIINYLVPYDWFWVVFIIQVINISGAAGDIYVFFRLLSIKGELLIKDDGTSMEIYKRNESGK
ncbi:MAG: DUF3267 domain-containing protein [Christensenellaceae bacterium]|nr:DUF3267 domain-containing protein [Christensenellaceae bacterium]